MSLQNSFPKINVLNIEVDNLGITQAIDLLMERLDKPGAAYIVKPHIQHVEAAIRQADIAGIINRAYLALPDGVSINWAAYYGQETRHRAVDVASSFFKIVSQPLDLHLVLPNHSWGTNFTWSLLEACAREGRSLFLVGSPRVGSIEQTADYLRSQIPGLKIVGTMCGRDNQTGYFSSDLQQKLLKQLQAVEPDFTLVGLGFPRQERAIAELAPQIKRGLLIGEGGTFDFAMFGGKIKKAPIFMQHRGLEWLWRLLIDPRRLVRQMAIPRFIWHVYRANRSKQIA